MNASKFIRIAAFSAIAIVASTAAAFAATAYTKSSAKVRLGPGTSYGVITTLPMNTKVDVQGCTPTGWCVITKGPLEGFVAKSLLKKTLTSVSPFDLNIIIGPNFQLGINLGDVQEEPVEPAEVCFYQGADLTGANFCVEPGESDEDIPGSFDNNIESILITGGAVVTVCTGTDFNGICREYDETMESLPSVVNNKITSYAVDEL